METAVFWMTFAVFNISIIFILKLVLDKANLTTMLLEKQVSVPSGSPPSGPWATSYSRVSGIIGSIVLACFFWAIGDIIIYEALYGLNNVGTLLKSLGPYIGGGAALFAPYAVNQVSTIFK